MLSGFDLRSFHSKGFVMTATKVKSQRAAATLNDPRWGFVLAKAASADGTFCYSVDTTGVYCRPSCGSRIAKPENVRFHSNCEEAERAGFRPCKRCKPDQLPLEQRHAAKIAEVCRLLEISESSMGLEELAEKAGMSAYHFHRTFKQVTGLTPRMYAAAHREARLRGLLGSGQEVTQAIYNAGYQSGSRFYENSDRVLGMLPTRYRSGGKGAEIRFAVGQCALGAILVAQSERGVCAILIGDDPDALARDLQDRFPKASLIGGDAEFEKTVALVVGFVEAPRLGLDLPLDIRGTAFQQRVWQALRDIPPGQTATYTEIARRIGMPSAVRAVAAACAANALAVAIPCHRVVRIGGGLSGYRWGVERKRSLLEIEADLQEENGQS
jgi:AraC family transcriptional regulator of adaptative response/methylated-DNA-[protein]-cysteine methyltransferase